MIIAVHPRAQRRGLARALLHHAAQQWPAHDVEEAFLEVRANNAPARALYQATGWSEVGLRKRYYSDGTDGVVYRFDATG